MWQRLTSPGLVIHVDAYNNGFILGANLADVANHALVVNNAGARAFQGAAVPFTAVESCAVRGADQQDWLSRSLAALEPYDPRIVRFPGEDRVPSPAEAGRALAAFRSLFAEGEGRYTFEEMRRLLLEDFPFLTPAHVERTVRPQFDLESWSVRNWGPERSFLLACHGAHFLLGQKPGATEAQAWGEFQRSAAEPLTLDDLRALQVIYPFVPRWEGGVKTDQDWSLDTELPPSSDPEKRDARHHWAAVKLALEQYASIHRVEPLLRSASRMRELRGLLGGDTRFIEVTGVFADGIPRLNEMWTQDGLAGDRALILGKNYSAAHWAVDVVRRVFGATVQVHPGNEAIEQAAVAELRAAVDSGAKNIVVHLEGILGVWKEVDRLARAHPEVRIACVSHTTSDARDLLKTVGEDTSLLVVTMGLSSAKIEDELERFRATFTQMLLELSGDLRMPLQNFRHVVLGYGSIIGPAAVQAVVNSNAGRGNLRVFDRDPAQRERAEADGFRTVGAVREAAGQATVVLSCAGETTMREAEFKAFARKGEPGQLVLVSLGSGRREFDMPWLEKAAWDSHRRWPDVVDAPRIVGRHNAQPVVRYALRFEEHGTVKDLLVYAVADGYVGNLAKLHPTPAPYAVTTPLLITESIREAVVRLRMRGQRGIQALTSVEFQRVENAVTGGANQILVTLFNTLLGRGSDPKKPSRVGQKDRQLLERNCNEPYLLRREADWHVARTRSFRDRRRPSLRTRPPSGRPRERGDHSPTDDLVKD
jgi:hypothetical protein